jgi:hypothetical protein
VNIILNEVMIFYLRIDSYLRDINKNMPIIRKKYLSLLALLSVTTITLFSCGGGSSSPSDPGTPTTMVTSFNGQFATPGKGQQFINPILAAAGGLDAGMMQVSNPWTDLSTNIITLSKISYVEGSNSATYYNAASVFSMTTDTVAGTRSFSGNGLPSTKMGTFPVQEGTSAYSYYSVLPGGNKPASIGGGTYSSAAAIGIRPFSLVSTVPLNPTTTGYYPIASLIVGVTLTGTVWHIEYANDSSNNWVSPINALPTDQCFGHPYNEQYHIHGYSWKCFPNQGTSGQSPVFGFALDGFPITGPRAADGHMMTNAELDQCHGTTSEITMPDGTLKNTYHYVLNREYPYSVGCFRGVVNYGTALGSTDMAQNVNYGSGPPTTYISGGVTTFPFQKLR